MKTVKYYLRVSIAAFAAAIACPSCNDAWDDHYDVQGDLVSGTAGASLWENLNTDAELAPFNRVLKACGYDVILNSPQMYTVWAPVITDEQADEWIKIYNDEVQAGRTGEENAAIKEFVMNHVALYNHQINPQTNETVMMRNGKYMTLTSNTIKTFSEAVSEHVSITDVRVPSSNGMMYKVVETLPYFRNIWEAIQADSVGENALDSVAHFFASFEKKILDPESSVPGDIDSDGNQHYIDSVLYRYNDFFTGSSELAGRRRQGYINVEDSLYYFLAPTNSVWKEKVEEYKKYFVCAHNATSTEKLAHYKDSLMNLYAKTALIESCFFNARRQTDATMNDSICSTLWSGPSMFSAADYSGAYRFNKPFADNGIFSGLTYEENSNGRLYKTSDWRILPSQTFIQPIKVEAENSQYYSFDESKMMITRESQNNDSCKVSGERYIVLSDIRTAGQRIEPEITFDIPNTLSNCPYDIKVVFATRLANNKLDSTDIKPRKVTVGLNYYRENADDFLANPVDYLSEVEVRGDVMDTVLVTREKGPFIPQVCNFPFESDERVKLTISSSIRRNQTTTYSPNLAIDCIIFEPRVEKEGTED